LFERDVLNAAAIREGLPTRFVGQHVVYFETIDSTNRVAKELGRGGAPDGTLVIAEAQTSGRGRLGRQWLAPPGSSLLLSLLFRPGAAARGAPHHLPAAHLTMLCALAAGDAIEQTAHFSARLKWPNDLLLGGKKVGGILTELGFQDDELDFVVVGLGLNVNVDFGQAGQAHPPDAAPDTSQASLSALAGRSTSLLQESGRWTPRRPLLQCFLARVEQRYLAWRAGWLPHAEWRQRLATLGQQVTVTAPDGVVVGLAEDVDADGALLVRAPDGHLVRVLAGDVTLRAADAPPEIRDAPARAGLP